MNMLLGKAKCFIFIVVYVFTSLTLSFGQSIDYDKEMGAKASVQIQQQIGIDQHKSASIYLDSIGNRLVSNLGEQPFSYQFHVLDMEIPNAMALPGGYVYFSRGILMLANSEDELAGIMGHEIIHVHKRHSVKSMRRGILPRILEIPGNIVKNVISPELGNLINTPIKLTGGLFQARYSRSNEKESDELGSVLAARSGYDPSALADILKNLARYQELESGKNEEFGFFDSHPYTPDRINNINKISSELRIDTAVTPIAQSREEFLKKLNGIVIGENPAKGIFNENKFIHPDLGIFVEFPKDWNTINTPTAVGAYQKDEEAQIFLAIAGEATSPKQYADKFLEKYRRSTNQEPVRNASIEVNGLEAHLISINDATGRSTTAIHLLWLELGEYTFQFIGYGAEKHKEVMKQTVLSFRKTTFAETDSVTVTCLTSITAKGGESLEGFSSRTGNILNLELLSLINNLKDTETLSQGQLLKIGKKEKYKK